jgi:hypothetical protein
MDEITLTESECLIAKFLAKTRTQKDLLAGAVATPYADRDQQEINENAFGAEMAYCKMFNIYPDLSTNPRVGGEDGITLLGEKVDVKNTERKWYHYFVKKTKSETPNAKVDYFAWMIGKLPTFEYIGCASWEDVVNCPTEAPYGEGSECFVVDSKLISPRSQTGL